jgi:hypothetical protein
MFGNEDEQLWQGDFMNAHSARVRQDVLTVPSPAIQRGPDGIFTRVIAASAPTDCIVYNFEQPAAHLFAMFRTLFQW